MNYKDLKIIENGQEYLVFVSEPVEGVARERHYAVLNKEHSVVEFRTPILSNAVQYMQEADDEFLKLFFGEDNNGQTTH